MREVITIVEMRMAVMHAAQKFPGGFSLVLGFRPHIIITRSENYVYLGAIQIMRRTMATTDQVTMK